jgi:hypothetical protein
MSAPEVWVLRTVKHLLLDRVFSSAGKKYIASRESQENGVCSPSDVERPCEEEPPKLR